MLYYYMRDQGVVAPVSHAVVIFTVDRLVQLFTGGARYVGRVDNFEIVPEDEVIEILQALKRGIPFT